MPIPVTCPGCLTRFTVSDKYAGKTGPCPKCKKELVVPDKSQEVVVHAPEVSGPKDSKGVAVLKPLKRAEFKLSKNEMIVASILFVLSIGFAIFGRVGFAEPPLWSFQFYSAVCQARNSPCLTKGESTAANVAVSELRPRPAS